MNSNSLITNKRQYIRALILKMFVQFGKQEEIDRMNVYIDELISSGYGDISLTSMVEKACRECKYLPSISDILSPVEGKNKIDEPKKLSYSERKSLVGTCTFNLCWGDGYLTVEKPNGYEYQFRCPCRYGQAIQYEVNEITKDGEKKEVGVIPTWNDSMRKSKGYKLIN